MAEPKVKLCPAAGTASKPCPEFDPAVHKRVHEAAIKAGEAELAKGPEAWARELAGLSGGKDRPETETSKAEKEGHHELACFSCHIIAEASNPGLIPPKQKDPKRVPLEMLAKALPMLFGNKVEMSRIPANVEVLKGIYGTKDIGGKTYINTDNFEIYKKEKKMPPGTCDACHAEKK